MVVECIACNQDADQDHHGCVRRGCQGQDEHQDGDSDRGNPPAGEALPVHYEYEARIDQGRAGFTLAQNYEHRDSDDQSGEHQVAETVYPET